MKFYLIMIRATTATKPIAIGVKPLDKKFPAPFSKEETPDTKFFTLPTVSL